ncbi:hypothetical protein [Polymorphobacter fuscus]|nr:hypothetical protein [Polymorphobacter fuscus]NJC07828.1 hypothetical protein [Polymorphobacter fuscus]
MIGNMNLGARGRLLWIGAAMLLGMASQYCVNFGACAAPLS